MFLCDQFQCQHSCGSETCVAFMRAVTEGSRECVVKLSVGRECGSSESLGMLPRKEKKISRCGQDMKEEENANR